MGIGEGGLSNISQIAILSKIFQGPSDINSAVLAPGMGIGEGVLSNISQIAILSKIFHKTPTTQYWRLVWGLGRVFKIYLYT